MQRINARQVWEEFVTSHPAGHLLQCWGWGELKAGQGWRALRLALVEAGRPVAGAQLLLRRLPLGFHLGYVPKGPLVDWQSPGQIEAVLAGLHSICRGQRSIFLKIEPNAPDDPSLARVLGAHAFVPGPSVQPRRSLVIDLSPPEARILAAMKQKTRYNIRLAERKGVQVRPGSLDDLDTFYQMMQLTGRRDGFAIHSRDYYRAAFQLFAPHQATLLLAEVEGEPVAGLMVFAHGSTAYYLFGASGDRHREKMPTYLLQWDAMRWAKARGCTQYDLWGIPDADMDTLEAALVQAESTPDSVETAKQPAKVRNGLWGVYRFKRGFGGHPLRTAGAFDYVYSRLGYWLYQRWLTWRRGGLA